MANHYDVLDIGRDSSQEEIKQAYHCRAMEYHPDKNPSPAAAEKMKQINEAYRVLSDPVLRAEYDKRFSSTSGSNIYSRWYRPDADGFGRGTPPEWRGPAPGPGNEAPRQTVTYESVTLFSFEHIMASGIVGLAFGIAITAAFVFFGIDLDAGYGLGILVVFAIIAAALPPFVTVVLLRDALTARTEAGLCGSVTLAFALPVAVLAGSYVRADAALGCCCLLPFVSILAGWIIGGFVGRMSWDIFRS